MRKAHWLTLDTAIGPVKVYVVRKIKGTADAAYYWWKNEIRVAESHKHYMKISLFHELIHIIWRGYSGHVREKILGNCKSKHEERVTGGLEPLFDLMHRNGMVCFPDPPKLPKKKHKGRKK